MGVTLTANTLEVVPGNNPQREMAVRCPRNRPSDWLHFYDYEHLRRIANDLVRKNIPIYSIL